jgi:hypothetical protein
MLLDPLSTRRPGSKPEVAAALYVGGKYMAEGKLEQMLALFDQECASHSAIVELREVTTDGTERPIRRRSPQR